MDTKTRTDMTKEEFGKRTGFGLDDEQMQLMHEVYMMTTDQDWNYFCALMKTMYEADRCCIEFMLDMGRNLQKKRKNAEKDMMIELIKKNAEWDKDIVIEDLGDRVVVYDDTYIMTRALLESVQSAVKAFNVGYYVATREGRPVLHIDVKEYEKVF